MLYQSYQEYTYIYLSFHCFTAKLQDHQQQQQQQQQQTTKMCSKVQFKEEKFHSNLFSQLQLLFRFFFLLHLVGKGGFSFELWVSKLISVKVFFLLKKRRKRMEQKAEDREGRPKRSKLSAL